MGFTPGATTVPVASTTLMSRQGMRPGRSAWHNGIDLSGTVGTPVYAASAGTVEKVTTDCLSDAQRNALSAREKRQRGGPCACSSTYGNYVVIKHADDFRTLYAHLNTVLVTVGQVVTTSTQIGTVGTTTALPNDRCTTMAPHLHFEVVKSWPLSSSDTASRYDVLHELAAGGVVISGDGLVATSVASEYSEPALRVSKAFKGTPNYDPTAGAPQKKASIWPLYVGFGGIVLVGGLMLWAGLSRRRTATNGLQGHPCRGLGSATQPKSFRPGQPVITPLGPGTVAYQRMRGPDYTEVAAVSVVLDSRKNDPRYTGTIFEAEKVTRDPSEE